MVSDKPYYLVEFKGRLDADGFEKFKQIMNGGHVVEGKSTTSGPFDPAGEECTCCAPGTGFRRHRRGDEGCKHAD
jgi:hypothetical protein